MMLLRAKVRDSKQILDEVLQQVRLPDIRWRMEQNIKNKTQEIFASRTSLIDAVWYGQTSRVQVLLDRRANINELNRAGWTALIAATWTGETKVARLLLERGAEVDQPDRFGWTPLHIAARYGHTDVVSVLLQDRADLLAKTAGGGRASPCSEVSTAHRDCILRGRKVGLDAKVNDDNLAWRSSTSSGLQDVDAHLFMNGIDPHVTTSSFSNTALHLAAQFGHVETTALLLQYEPNITAKNKPDGYTALHLAAHNGFANLALLLLQHGAKLQAMTNSGRTALDLAAGQGHRDLEELLLQHEAKNEGIDSDASHNAYRTKEVGRTETVSIANQDKHSID